MSNDNKSDEEWQKELTPLQYHVLREKGTEIPFTGKLYKENRDGMYHCAACNAALFSSDAKYDSGCGWPSFNEVTKSSAVILQEDNSHGMHRTEVLCKQCHSHLGHLFPTHLQPTGKWFCINSAALSFERNKQ